MSFPVFAGAITISTALNNRVIRWRENVTTANATIAEGTYFLRGDGTASDLCLAIKTAIEAATGSTNTYNVTVSRSISNSAAHTTITITRATGADTFQLLKDGSQTFDYDLIGFTASTAQNSTAKTSDVSCLANWSGNDIYSKIFPFSTKIQPQKKAPSGRRSSVARSARMQGWSIGMNFIHENRLFIAKRLSGTGQTLESFIEYFGSNYFEMHSTEISATPTLSAISSGTLLDTVVFDEQIVEDFKASRVGDGLPLFNISFDVHKRV
jgi:hypothetical protein